MSLTYKLKCPQCGRGDPDKSADAFLLGDTVFCDEDCADEWIGWTSKEMDVDL